MDRLQDCLNRFQDHVEFESHLLTFDLVSRGLAEIMFNENDSTAKYKNSFQDPTNQNVQAVMANSEALVGIDEVQKSLNRSRASVYRYTNTDTRNLNPPFNPRKLNPEYRSDQKDPLLFHPNEVARFAKDILRIKEVTVEILNSPSTATQTVLNSILEELRAIRSHLELNKSTSAVISNHLDEERRSAA